MSVFPPTQLVAPEAIGEPEILAEKHRRSLALQGFRFPDGSIDSFSFFDAVRCPVYVLPVTADGRFVLVRQFRYGLNGFAIEAPGGRGEEGESFLDTLRDEIRTETGYRPGTIIQLAESLVSNPTIRKDTIPFLALDCEEVGQSNPDKTEVLEVLECSVEECLRAIICGEIRDSVTIAMVFRALPHIGCHLSVPSRDGCSKYVF